MTNDNTQTTEKKTQKKTICKNLQTAASSWEQILHTSGGALELIKCAWYLINWDFTSSGIPFISTKTNTNTIDIQSSSDNKLRSINNLTINEICTYLGVTSAPDGNQQHQFKVILKKQKQAHSSYHPTLSIIVKNFSISYHIYSLS